MVLLALFWSCGRYCELFNEKEREGERKIMHVPGNKKLTGSRVLKGKSVRPGRSHEVWAGYAL